MITVYTKPSCIQCEWTKKWLERAGLPYDTVDVTQDDAAAAALKELGYMTAPVVFVSTPGGDVHWGGFQPERLMEHLRGRAA